MGQMEERTKEQKGCWKVEHLQYGKRADRQREKKRSKMSYCRQSARKRYTYLRRDTIREMACLQINWN